MTEQSQIPPRRVPVTQGQLSLAKLLHEYNDKREIERVDRNTEWVAVHRDTAGDYIRIVGGRDLPSLRYQKAQVDRDEPEEREPRHPK